MVAKDAKVSWDGSAIIPDGTTEIWDRAFDSNEGVRSVFVPGTVKRIGRRAFADCTNLSRVELAEGINYIDQNAFTGCSKLQKVILPDSIYVDEMDGWAFYQCTGLRTPVYNRSGTVLYAYPCMDRSKSFVIPERVKRIGAAAFLKNPYLEEVILPDGLERIGRRSFIECGIRRITIPASVKVIEPLAFLLCKELKIVTVKGKETVISVSAFDKGADDIRLISKRHYQPDEWTRILGEPFLLAPKKKQLPDGWHVKDKKFLDLAAECALGKAGAMWEMGEYFKGLGEEAFYVGASNFWRYRAYQNGSQEAKVWMEQWFLENADARHMESVMPEHMLGNYDGRYLNYCGFLFFDPERDYTLDSRWRREHYSLVEVNSWCDDDGPDEDGFGREEYYDWWYLDGNLREIEGVGMIHSYSYRDRKRNLKKFQEMQDRAEKKLSEMWNENQK
ncbi:MAG: leucine-rich repeat domain-containing protein [Blautia sp.]